MKQGTTYCIYLLECRDGSYYCGIAADMDKRLKQHNAGTASKYTRGRRPVIVLAQTGCWFSRSMALKLERAVKKLSKHQKASTIAGLSKPAAMPQKQVVKR